MVPGIKAASPPSLDYLTKQACQLRDANEARLRIYETLEQSVGELERNNRDLQDESRGDKKRIKALCASLELVEQHCEELQEAVESMKHRDPEPGEVPRRKRSAEDISYHSSEESNTDEDSGILGDESDFAGFEDTPLELQEVLRLRSDVARLRSQISREQRVRENLTCELERAVQENARLREELLASRERERHSLNLQMDMGGVHNLQNSEKLCPNCRLMEDQEDELTNLDSSLTTDPDNTLLFELDMQYRVLIEKYEALLEARRRDFSENDPQAFESGFSENGSSPTPSSNQSAPSPPVSKDVSCQTEIQVLKKKTPIVTPPSRNMGVKKTSTLTPTLSDADQATFDKHFAHSPPEYKKLFAEIFAVLKRKVAEIPTCTVASILSQTPPAIFPELETRLECNLEKLKATVPPHVRFTRSYAEVVRTRGQSLRIK